SLTTSLSRSPSRVRGRCRPGVSTTTIWAFGRCTSPRIGWRVVSGWSAVIAIFSPTKALVSVDLPVFGRPTKLTKPERKPSGVSKPSPAPALSVAGLPAAGLAAASAGSIDSSGKFISLVTLPILPYCRLRGGIISPRGSPAGTGLVHRLGVILIGMFLPRGHPADGRGSHDIAPPLIVAALEDEVQPSSRDLCPRHRHLAQLECTQPSHGVGLVVLLLAEFDFRSPLRNPAAVLPS